MLITAFIDIVSEFDYVKVKSLGESIYLNYVL